jgi:hypothetical protein
VPAQEITLKSSGSIEDNLNLEEMDECIEIYDLPELNQVDKENLSRSGASNKFGAVIKSIHTKKSQGLGEFSAEFYQTFKEN